MDGSVAVLKTPYADLLPPLSEAEFESLKSSIEAEGVHTPIVVTEDGRILDGHHRHQIYPNAPRRVVPALSDAESQAVVISSNLGRRNLSAKALKALRPKQKLVAAKLKEEGHTQEKIAAMLGVARNTISDWLRIPNVGPDNSNNPPPDKRQKLSDADREEIIKRVEAGELQKQIATDYGVTQSLISRICKEDSRLREDRDDPNIPARKLGNRPRMKVPDGETVESAVRSGMQSGASAIPAARAIGLGAANYGKVSDILRLLDMDLAEEDRVLCRAVMDEINTDRQIVPYERLRPLIARIWGDNKHYSGLETKRLEAFRRAVSVVILGAAALAEIEIPYLGAEERDGLMEELKAATAQVRSFHKTLGDM